MKDEFESFVIGLESPPQGGFAITPDDGTDLPFVTRAINCGTAGTLHVTLANGSDVTLTIAAGIILPLRARRVWASGTTAAQIVGLH